MKTIALTGSTGFVGVNLCNYFSSLGYEVLRISKEDLNNKKNLEELITKADIIINLAGANIIKRWTSKYKKILYSSRINTTQKLVLALKEVKKKPRLFISTSAIGIYGSFANTQSTEKFDENSKLSDDFLAKLCKDWEKEALSIKSKETKVSIFRFSVVLGKNGGALEKMLPAFKLGLGGVIGLGKQAFSFIHLDDLLATYEFVIKNEYEGIFNLSSPKPTTNYDFTKTLGKVLSRPTILPIPQVILKIIFSQGAIVLTKGQSVIPKRLIDLGFKFKYENIEETLNNICKNKGK